MSKSKDMTTISIPAIGGFWKEQGGIYAGIIGGTGGQDYHLIHATAEHEIFDANNEKATTAARASINGFTDWSLPDRREAHLLGINSSDSFDLDDYYRTSTPYTNSGDCTWIHDFRDGNQGCGHESYECRARAVRRVPIIKE